MQKRAKFFLRICVCLLPCAPVMHASAQFTLTGQLRTRTEIRNGLGNLVAKSAQPAIFTSQRTRLNVGYKWDRLTFGMSIQDVRVWGQDASSTSNADGSKLMLHEGWADIMLLNRADSTIKYCLVDQLSMKIGRQELIYDDARLIGNLDWLQQARRHDMALLKLLHHGWQLEVGYAFNQNSDAFNITGTGYTPGNLLAYVKSSTGVLVPVPAGFVPLAPGGSAANNSSKTGTPVYANPPGTNGANQQYKSFASVYVSRQFKQTKLSALFFNDHFGKYRLDSIGNATDGYVYGRRFSAAGSTDTFNYSGTSSRYTYGIMLHQTIGNSAGFGEIAFHGAYYTQTGKNRDGISNNAYHYTFSLTYRKNKWSLTPGCDVLSGNGAVSPSGKDNRFDPLYGTPHKFWGYMDYFYAGTGAPVGGVNNWYMKAKYIAKAFNAGIDYHYFALNKEMKKAEGALISKCLGYEIDFQVSYDLNRFTNIELGYSLMNATGSMPFAKAQATTNALANTYRKSGTWCYAMINIRPDFFFDEKK